MRKKINMNNHVFKGHKTLFGTKYVTYAELELNNGYEFFSQSQTFDWGYNGSAPLQLAFAILYKLSDKEFAKKFALEFSTEFIKNLKGRDWIIEGADVLKWIKKHREYEIKTPVNSIKKPKLNVVKQLCNKINLTQKELASILEVTEETINSWTIKNEVPHLAKKAIEFYILNLKHQKVIEDVKKFTSLIKQAS